MIIYERDRSEVNYIYNQFDTALNFAAHVHRSLEFVYVRKGTLLLTIEGTEYALTSNTAALILPYRIHSYSSESADSCLCVFSPDLASDFAERFRNTAAKNPVLSLTASECAVIERDFERLTGGANEYGKRAAIYDFLEIYTAHAEIIPAPAPDELLTRILGFVAENFTRNISLLEMSKFLGYSYNYLSSIFNTVFKTRFLEFVNEYRLDFACRLLKSGEHTITHIATLSGFDTVRTFNRNFLASYRMTPKEYKIKSGNTRENFF